jgi:hypothetical protein
MAAKYLNGEWWYAPHEEIFASGSQQQDHLWKCNIPSSERIRVLKLLDKHNLNAFSLFQSQEALMETLAIRELEIREGEL